jgi:hypothetical protein
MFRNAGNLWNYGTKPLFSVVNANGLILARHML